MQNYGLKNKIQPLTGLLINMLKTSGRKFPARENQPPKNGIYWLLWFSISSTILSARS